MKPAVRTDRQVTPAALILILVCFTVLVGCHVPTPSTQKDLPGQSFAQADALFHRDPRWLGADGAGSISIDHNRTLWLFDDTFIATSKAHVRSESKMVHNTIAIQTGTDPRTASITFHWRRDKDGSPAAFFPNNEKIWYWPGHGIRLDHGPLIVFLYAMAASPGRGLGFQCKGYALAIIRNPDAPPDTWRPAIGPVHPDFFDIVPATAVLQDQTHVIAVAIRRHGIHAGALVRYPKADFAQGDVNRAEWWMGKERGWIPQASFPPERPVFVLNDAGSECSVHWDARVGAFIHIASYGFGASSIGMRQAPALTGPWSAPVTIYRPPESGEPQVLVYAAKAHPELTGPTPVDLVITYATNSFSFGDLFTPKGASSLYWPQFVILPVDK